MPYFEFYINLGYFIIRKAFGVRNQVVYYGLRIKNIHKNGEWRAVIIVMILLLLLLMVVVVPSPRKRAPIEM